MINKTKNKIKNQTTVGAWPCVRPPRKEYPNNTGITLIALVITIIVLLILAGVALSLVIGQDGILGRAESAVNQTDIAEGREQAELLASSHVTDYYDKKYVNNDSDVSEKSVADYVAEKLKDGEDSGDYNVKATGRKIEVSKNGTTITTGTIKDDGSIDWGKRWEYGTDEEGNTTITDGTQTLKIGDYVNYDPKDGATTTSVTSYGTDNGYGDQKFNLSSYDYGWRVLGVDENTGGILLIAEEFIGPDEGGYVNTTYNRTYYYLQGKAGYANGIDELKKICSMYGQGKYATGGRSITVEDVNKITGYDPDTAGYGAGQIYEYGNKVTYSRNGTSTLYYRYYSGKNEVSGSNTQATFDWFDKRTRTWKSLSSTDTGSVDLTSTYYDYNAIGMSSLSSIGEELLFGIKGPSPYGGGGQYYFTNNGAEMIFWLGSSYVCADEGFAHFGLFNVCSGIVRSNGFDLFYSGGAVHDNRLGVRPAVSLQSDVQLNYNRLTREWDIAE